MPLAISTGAGSVGQNAIGTGVLGGMFTATVLAIFFVPVFFLVVRNTFRGDGGVPKPENSVAKAQSDGLP